MTESGIIEFRPIEPLGIYEHSFAGEGLVIAPQDIRTAINLTMVVRSGGETRTLSIDVGPDWAVDLNELKAAIAKVEREFESVENNQVNQD